jgi:hypothetical protein
MRSPLSLTALALIAAASLLTAAACDDGNTASTEAATQQDLDETARVVGALMAAEKGGDMATLRDGVISAKADFSGGFALDASGLFRGQHLGLSYDVEVDCYDPTGAPLNCGDGEAASADLVASWSGALQVGGLSIESALAGDWMLDKIDEDTAVIDGDATAVLDVSLTQADSTRSLHFAFAASYQAVQFTMDTHRPTSGRIVYAVDLERRASNAQGERVAKLSADAVVTLGSDATATLELSGSRYLVHLDTGAVDRM